MVAQYTVMGRQVGSHYLAMATLGAAGLIGYLSMGGSKKEQGPALNATSKDEEKFIKYVRDIYQCIYLVIANDDADGDLRSEFMEKAEAEAKKAKH